MGLIEQNSGPDVQIKTYNGADNPKKSPWHSFCLQLEVILFGRTESLLCSTLLKMVTLTWCDCYWKMRQTPTQHGRYRLNPFLRLLHSLKIVLLFPR